MTQPLPIDEPREARPGQTRRRRTQAERRTRTRGKLLDAAIACLVERGYAEATTPDICRRAGVSQGALFKHFPTKAALLVAAVERLYADLRERFRSEVGAVGEEQGRIDAAVRRLWEIFQRPELLAAMELQVAARTDRGLADALRPLHESHWRHMLELARELFPAQAQAHPHFEAYIDLFTSAMQGGAVGSLVGRDERRIEGRLSYLQWVARQIPIAAATDGRKP